MTSRYHAYGLSIESAIALPELAETREETSATSPNVIIDIGTIKGNGLEAGDPSTLNWVDPETFWFHVEGVGQYLVRQGREIVIQPDPGSDEDALRAFLLGSAFGTLLFQRGMLVLHGNSVRIGDACLICVGDSGAGKSTLAAGFLKRGFEVLADDVVPVDDQGRAIAGFARIKLWQDTADRLGIDTAGLRRIMPGMDKYNLPIKGHGGRLTLPIRWIYVLESGPAGSISITPTSGMDRFPMLLANTYRGHFLDGTEMLKTHLQLCGKLASQAWVARVTRPTEGFAIDALVDALIEDTAAHPGSGLPRGEELRG